MRLIIEILHYWKHIFNYQISQTNGKKEFAIAAFNSKYEIFVVYVAALRINLGNKMHPSKKAQIAHLKVDKVLFKMLSKYANFADVFLPKLAAKILKYIEINNYAIKLADD